MKAFKVPEIEVVIFTQNNVVTCSCECDDCTSCPEGSNDCKCVDSWSSDYKKAGDGVGLQGVTIID